MSAKKRFLVSALLAVTCFFAVFVVASHKYARHHHDTSNIAFLSH